MTQQNHSHTQLYVTLSNNGHETVAEALVALDAAAFVSDNSAMQASFAAETPILLTDVTEAHKDLLSPHMGTRLEGRSDCLFLLARPYANGAPCFYIADMGHEDDAIIPEVGYDKASGNLSPPPRPDNAPEETAIPQDAAPDIDQDALRLQGFCEGVTRILGLTESGDFPPDAVYATWYFNQAYNWGCPKASKGTGFTPQMQATYGTVDYMLQAFLDEPASGNSQWVYVQALGFWSAGETGMNHNAYNQKGWAIGTVNVNVTEPGGFNTIDQSPKNINGKASVTTGSSFQVNMSTDAAGGSYTVENSKTNTISDWGVTLDDLNKWTFRQYSKFNGTTKKFPKDEVYYSSSNVRYQLYALPDLSKKVLNFCTMSVFRNTKVQTGIATFNCAIGCQYYYIGISTSWPDYSGTYWYYTYPPSARSLSIDLTLVSQPKSA